MTPAQQFKLYFPAWSDCVAANRWHIKNKTVTIQEETLTEEARKVVAYARARATARCSVPRISLDDLRHGAHTLALGRDKSSAAFTNRELDRVVTLFQLLTNPENLEARLKWDAYQRGEDPGASKRIDWFIRHAAPDAYVRAIAEDKFGRRAWEHLDLGQKRTLAMTLANRRKNKARPLTGANRENGELKTSASVPSVSSCSNSDSGDPDWTVP